MNWAKKLVLGVAFLAGSAAAVDVATYDEDAWLADYERLKGALAQDYANLDWMVEKRGLDLVAFDGETRDRLMGARSRVQAFMAINDFIRRFGDPHLRMKLTREEDGARPAVAAFAAEQIVSPPVQSCEAAGYSSDEQAFAPWLASVPGLVILDDGPFPTALHGKTGIVRIGDFGDDKYLSACQAALRQGMSEETLKRATRDRLDAEMRAAIAQLKAAGAKRLVVDVTGNGGGTEWVSEIIPMFTAATLTRSEARIADAACDRSNVWRGRRAACGIFGDEAAATTTIRGSGEWRGPLYILADHGSASATEDFIAWLVDNKAATLAGERTYGAGCGYVDGGNPFVLRVIPFTVHMPNCARYRSNGVNEVEGIAPDIAIPLSELDDEQKTQAMQRFFARL